MRVAKIQLRPNKELFAQVLKVGSVQFDPRPGWVFMCVPVGARPRKQEVFWMHPEDEMFLWVREFNFGEADVAL